jgi:hypothetical protein
MDQSSGGSPAKGNAGRLVYQHVQAIIVAIDQYAEAATGNRCFFLNKPQSVGGSRMGNVP